MFSYLRACPRKYIFKWEKQRRGKERSEDLEAARSGKRKRNIGGDEERGEERKRGAKKEMRREERR